MHNDHHTKIFSGLGRTKNKNTPFKGILTITGMHRSGTTFVGNILNQFDHIDVIHEPLNMEFGLAGVKHVYPCDKIIEQKDYYLGLLQDMLTAKAGYIRTAEDDGILKIIGRFLLGGRTGFDMIKHRLKAKISPRTLVIKDPFQIMLLDTMIKEGVSAIVIVRHPAAVWQSILRMDWKLDIKQLGNYNLLSMDPFRCGNDNFKNKSEVVKFSIVWRMIYEYIHNLTNNSRLLVVKHEDICTMPYDFIKKLEKRYNLRHTRKVYNYIDRMMFSNTIDKKSSKLHEFKRNSRELARSWIDNINPEDEKVIREIAGDLVDVFYGDWYAI